MTLRSDIIQQNHTNLFQTDFLLKQAYSCEFFLKSKSNVNAGGIPPGFGRKLRIIEKLDKKVY